MPQAPNLQQCHQNSPFKIINHHHSIKIFMMTKITATMMSILPTTCPQKEYPLPTTTSMKVSLYFYHSTLKLEGIFVICGIVQLLCQIFHIILGISPSIPPQTITTDNDIFNKYEKPSQGASWNQHAINIHGNTPSDDCIQSAYGIKDVWNECCTFMEKRIFSNEVSNLRT